MRPGALIGVSVPFRSTQTGNRDEFPLPRFLNAALRRAVNLEARLLSKHDRAQEEFDRVETINFERRMLRLMRYRIERMQATSD